MDHLASTIGEVLATERHDVLIQGDFVQAPTLGKLEIFQNYLLRTDASGIIDHFADATHPTSLSILNSEHPPKLETHTNGSFILPTFCDLHLHAPQFLYQGTGLHLPLMQWLDEYAFKAEESLDADPKLAENVYQKLAAKLIENGTGAVLLFGTIKTKTNLILARTMQENGLRAFVGKLSMDISSRPSYKEESAEAALEAAQDFYQRCQEVASAEKEEHRRLVEPVLTPRFVPTCSDKLLSGLGKLAKEKGLRIQSHMAESHDQVEWVRAERKAEDMDVFARHNLLTTRTVQAHCTFLSPSDLSNLSSTRTAIAHCPLSNAYFSAEPFRLREALDAGVPVGLGTDIAGGYSIDIMNGMRQAVAVSRMREGARVMAMTKADAASGAAGKPGSDIDSKGKGREKDEGRPLSIDWKEALYLATAGGAIALGLPKGIGTFAVGVPFDAQSIELYRDKTVELPKDLRYTPEAGIRDIGGMMFFDDPRPQGLAEDIVEKWWCLGDARNRRGMWVQGRYVGRETI